MKARTFVICSLFLLSELITVSCAEISTILPLSVSASDITGAGVSYSTERSVIGDVDVIDVVDASPASAESSGEAEEEEEEEADSLVPSLDKEGLGVVGFKSDGEEIGVVVLSPVIDVKSTSVDSARPVVESFDIASPTVANKEPTLEKDLFMEAQKPVALSRATFLARACDDSD